MQIWRGTTALQIFLFPSIVWKFEKDFVSLQSGSNHIYLERWKRQRQKLEVKKKSLPGYSRLRTVRQHSNVELMKNGKDASLAKRLHQNQVITIWNGYKQQQRYYIKAVEVKNDDGGTDYVALIMQRSHPQFNDIVSRYDSEIAMFNEFKP